MGLDLSGSAVAVVAGPPKSGRTNLLRFAARAARTPARPVLALSPLENALTRALGEDAAAHRRAEVEEPALVERFRALAEGAVILVDDAELLKESPLGQALLAMVQQARGKKWRVLVAGAERRGGRRLQRLDLRGPQVPAGHAAVAAGDGRRRHLQRPADPQQR